MIPYLNHVVKTCDTRDLKLKVSKWMTDSAYKWRPSWFCSSKLCETNESRSHLINAYAIFFCIASEHIWANSRTNLKANIKLKFNGVFLFLISKKKMLLDFINEISELFFLYFIFVHESYIYSATVKNNECAHHLQKTEGKATKSQEKYYDNLLKSTLKHCGWKCFLVRPSTESCGWNFMCILCALNGLCITACIYDWISVNELFALLFHMILACSS